MDHCTRKLLGLTDENFFFEEEWFETIEEEGVRTNLIHASLAIYQAIAVNVVSKMKDKSSRMAHIKQNSNFCLIDTPKQNYAWYVRAFTVKNVSRHSMLRQIWQMKTAIFQKN